VGAGQGIGEFLRLAGYLLLVPAIGLIFWIAINAADAEAAGEAVGDILGPLVIVFLVIWIVLRAMRLARIGHLWPWTIVLTAIAAGAIALLPIGATADRAIDSYVVSAGEFSSVRSAELGDVLDAALANEGLEEATFRNPPCTRCAVAANRWVPSQRWR
jgi:hypothetical protein